MAEKIKKASPYFLILVLVGLVIAFNFWSSLDKNLWNKYVEADSGAVGSSVSVGNVAPTIKVVNVYGGDISTIVLIENTAIDLMATVTIEDDNGCSDIQNGNVEAWFLLGDKWWNHTDGGTSCTYDENDCYDNTVVSCSFASCAGNIVTYQCVASAAWQYFADSSEVSEDQSSNTDDEWIVIVYASDSTGNDVTSDSWLASDSANVNLYSAIDVEQGASDSIVYGSVAPNNVSAIKEIGIRNTGNRGVDPIIEEVGSMSLNGQDSTYINTARQKYNPATFTMPAGGTSLSADNTTITLDLSLPQRGWEADHSDDDPYTSVSDDQLYWGIDIPSGQTPGDYKGSVSYTSSPD